MPEPDEILSGLSRIANDAFGVSVAWHGIVAAVAVALLVGFRPRRRTAALALTAPLASVSALAWSYDNPFNGAVFALVAASIAGLSLWGKAAPEVRSRWAWVLGVCLVAFGWFYPHFLVERSPWAYLYGAPLGTIPCPTLALVTGAVLIGGGLGSPAAQLVIASAAAFYSLFGVLRLGVTLDLVLLAGAVGAAIQSTQARAASRAPKGGTLAATTRREQRRSLRSL